MSIKMEPVVPAPPDESPYGLGVLSLFPRLTRAEYKERFGEQAPPFDMTRKAKLWAYTTVEGPYTYRGFDERTGEFTSHTMPEAEARAFNIPGTYDYPKWNPETSATRSGEALSPYLLTTKPEAETIASELEVAFGRKLFKEIAIPVSRDSLIEGATSWNGETRRIHQMTYPDSGVENCGLVLREKRRRGIGHPGHWRIDRFLPTWIIDPAPTGAGVEEVEMPYRALLPDEKGPRQTPLGWVIERGSTDTGGGSVTGGGFTARDREMLVELHRFFMRR